MVVLTRVPFDLPLEAVLPRVHVEPDSEDAESLRALLERVRPVARPKAIYAICFVDQRGADTVDIGGVTFTSRVLRVNLQESHRVFPYIATCGRELEQARAMAHDPLQGYWFDQIQVMALEAAAAYLREHLAARYEPGKISSMSPGSLDDWPITQQRQLFSLFGDVEAKIGVHLTESYLMLPLKSVSGMYFATEYDFQSCRLCPRKHCLGRRAAYDETLWVERYAGQPEG